uniref:Uncharacterized protein n=1 Tax=Ciona savignyi TaxID=51511 RepID=H2YLG1_CIOSA
LNPILHRHSWSGTHHHHWVTHGWADRAHGHPHHRPHHRHHRHWTPGTHHRGNSPKTHLSFLKCLCGFINKLLCLFLHPSLVIHLHVVFVLSSGTMGFPHRW